jgi:hypothetical protein
MAKKLAGRVPNSMRFMIDNRRGGSKSGGTKTQGKPSSEHISGRRKAWLSLRETTDGRGNDTGKRSGQPWWRSPSMKAERLARWAK